MKKIQLVIIFTVTILILSGCVFDKEKEKEQSTTQSITTNRVLSEEQKQLKTLLENVEALINEETNYTLSTSVEIRYYEHRNAIAYTVNTVNLTEKFEFEQPTYEYSYHQKIGFDSIEEGYEAYRIVDNRQITFRLLDEKSFVNEIKPYGGNFNNQSLINLKILKQNVPNSMVHIDDLGRIVVKQSLFNVTDHLKTSKLDEMGLNYQDLERSLDFVYEYDTNTNILTITVTDNDFPLSDYNYSHAELSYTMTFYDIGSTEVIASVVDYNGKVGSSEDSVLVYSDVESLFTKTHINYDYYKIRVAEPSIYRLEWTNGKDRPYIGYIDYFGTSNDMHEWIDDEAIYFEPGEYIIKVNDSFRFIKEDYLRHEDYSIYDQRTFTFQPQGQYDFTKLYVHTDPLNPRQYVKIKLSDNGYLYDSLNNKGKYQIEQGEDGFYYSNGGRFYLMSSDGNPVTVEVVYEDIHEKDKAPIIATTYGDYYYSNNRYDDYITYQTLKINQVGDYMISVDYLNSHPEAQVIITDQYENILFERDNHSIIHLEPGMYYVYLVSEETCFYQMKYTNMTVVE